MRYLRALHVYKAQRPELTSRLMSDYPQEAAIAQMTGRVGVADQHLQSVVRLALESVKATHATWVRAGSKDTFAAVFVALSDAQLMNADHHLEVEAIAREVHDLYLQGKVKQRRPGPSLWIERTLEY